jgi:predicted nucleic acid-binding protein
LAWLIDTNILLRMAQPGHPMHRAATTAVKILLERGERLCIVPQNLTEFWSVATRGLGSLNGLGMDVDEARQEVLRLINLLQFMPEIPAIFPIWLRLVSDHRILAFTSMTPVWSHPWKHTALTVSSRSTWLISVAIQNCGL